MEHVVLKNRRTTLERAEKFISKELSYFNDVSLCGKIYPKKAPLKSLTHYAAPGRIKYSEAVKGDYKSTKVGESFGPAWATHWFCVDVEIPADWQGKEVHFLWNSNSEAMVWRNGQPLRGLTEFWEKINFVISGKLKKSELRQQFYIEMACNGLFGNPSKGLLGPPNPDAHYTLSQAEVAVFDKDAFSLMMDFQVITGMAKHLGEESERGNQAMYTANQMVNLVVADGGCSYQRARDLASKFLHQKNGDSQHIIHAIGNCHIDTAWLWPYAETIRKCARSWSTTIRLLETYPDFTFACSQAQQFEWVKEHYPSLFEEMRKFIKEGRFIPVGACWVEMDGNMPSGEAFIRQFLYGQRFYKKEFDFTCKEFWLPDTFGYSGQIPQIMKLFGINRFLTQKISWNLVNKFPHNTFWWVGIDGSKVLTHFPPADSYALEANVEEVVKTQTNHGDKGRSARTMFLYGQGDGGQGPSEDMVERLRRMQDVDGLPKVKFSTPDAYFSEVETLDSNSLCTWSGELYLEMHNGTYTTQAQTKFYNRRCEFLLHDVEAIATIATVLSRTNGSGYKYPGMELLRLWKLLLLNQFHDVLPGSSIAMVYEDTLEYYQDIEKTSNKLMSAAVKAVCEGKAGSVAKVLFNSQGWQRSEVVSIPMGEAFSSPVKKKQRKDASLTQTDCDGNTLALVTVPSYGLSPLEPQNVTTPVSAVKQEDGLIHLKNELIEATVNAKGHVTGLYVVGRQRNAMSGEHAGNVFVIYDDVPLYWDAWDVMHYHLETRKVVGDVIEQAKIIDDGPLRASIQVTSKISDRSTIRQRISLDASSPFVRFETKVEWHESHKFLKVEFPTSVKSENASYEIQFGHLQRPTHTNNSWDMAKFEVCSHKWADLSEYDFGVAVLNESKYGFSTARNVMRLSLLRSPKAPDADADMGTQTFTYAVMPHTGTLQSSGVIQQAYNLNCPLTVESVSNSGKMAQEPQSCFTLDNPQVVLDTVKMNEDDHRMIVLRLYEAFGGTATTNLSTSFHVKEVVRCDGYEDEMMTDDDSILSYVDNNNIRLTLGPFQVVCLLLRF